MLTRRKAIALGSASVIVGGTGILSRLRAQGTATRIRHDARSPEGKKMLALYAAGVAAMKGSQFVGTVSSWTFQWYIHAVSGSTDKQSEIDRLFPDMADPNRDLADQLWNTCQSHFPGMQAENFLPWHRAYVLAFEEHIREACGDEAFTLPYWNYIDDAVLPIEFRSQNDAVYGSLFVEDRNPGVNQGEPITTFNGQPLPGILNLDAMSQGSYLPGSTDSTQQGFNIALDTGLHGNVHGLVGNLENMGRVPFAANDPIFWLHHCNIDRIWAGWNDAGRDNPTEAEWTSVAHSFAGPHGVPILMTNGEVTTTEALGYVYDSLPPAPAPESAVTAAGFSEQLARAENIVLGSDTQNVTLVRPSTASAEPLPIVPMQADRKRYLVIEGVRADVQPGILYHVFSRSAGSSDFSTDLYLGSINFFGTENRENSFVFHISERVDGTTARELQMDPLSYYFVPSGQPQEGSQASIGAVTLVEE